MYDMLEGCSLRHLWQNSFNTWSCQAVTIGGNNRPKQDSWDPKYSHKDEEKMCMS